MVSSVVLGEADTNKSKRPNKQRCAQLSFSYQQNIFFSFQSSIKIIQMCNHKNRILYLRKRYFNFVPSAVVYSSWVAFNKVISDNTEGEL